MPLQQGQQLHCNDGKDACTSMLTRTPLQQGHQCQLDGSNNAIKTRATMLFRIKGNDAIVMMATTRAQ
jgi:hypothetical protein